MASGCRRARAVLLAGAVAAAAPSVGAVKVLDTCGRLRAIGQDQPAWVCDPPEWALEAEAPPLLPKVEPQLRKDKESGKLCVKAYWNLGHARRGYCVILEAGAEPPADARELVLKVAETTGVPVALPEPATAAPTTATPEAPSTTDAAPPAPTPPASPPPPPPPEPAGGLLGHVKNAVTGVVSGNGAGDLVKGVGDWIKHAAGAPAPAPPPPPSEGEGQVALPAGAICKRFCEDSSEGPVNLQEACPEDAPCASPAPVGTVSFDTCGDRAWRCGGQPAGGGPDGGGDADGPMTALLKQSAVCMELVQANCTAPCEWKEELSRCTPSAASGLAAAEALLGAAGAAVPGFPAAPARRPLPTCEGLSAEECGEGCDFSSGTCRRIAPALEKIMHLTSKCQRRDSKDACTGPCEWAAAKQGCWVRELLGLRVLGGKGLAKRAAKCRELGSRGACKAEKGCQWQEDIYDRCSVDQALVDEALANLAQALPGANAPSADGAAGAVAKAASAAEALVQQLGADPPPAAASVAGALRAAASQLAPGPDGAGTGTLPPPGAAAALLGAAAQLASSGGGGPRGAAEGRPPLLFDGAASVADAVGAAAAQLATGQRDSAGAGPTAGAAAALSAAAAQAAAQLAGQQGGARAPPNGGAAAAALADAVQSQLRRIGRGRRLEGGGVVSAAATAVAAATSLEDAEEGATKEEGSAITLSLHAPAHRDQALHFEGLQPSTAYQLACAALDVQERLCHRGPSILECLEAPEQGRFAEFTPGHSVHVVQFRTSASVVAGLHESEVPHSEAGLGATAIVLLVSVAVAMLGSAAFVAGNWRRLSKRYWAKRTLRIARPEDHELMACPVGPEGWSALNDGPT